MADTIPTGTSVVPPTAPQVQATLQPLADDAAQLEKETVALVAAYKAKGAAGAAALLPTLTPTLEKSYVDLQAALPTIKAGYKTSEFWIATVVVGFMAYYTATGKVPPVDGATIMGAVTAVYAVVRGLLKK